MLPQLIQHPLNNLYILFVFTFGIDKNIIEVYYHNKVELLCQDLIDITLKHGRYISQSKRHHPVLKMAIAGLEDRLAFVSFSNYHLMIGIS